jgi:hypothetical protein
MKRKFTLALGLFVACAANAGTITLNNSNPSAGQYSTWVDAQGAANNGDTILIQGSAANYGDITVNKRLVIIGPGHNPTDKQNSQKAFFNKITFNIGASNSEVSGVEVYEIHGGGNATGVKVRLCKITNRLTTDNYGNDTWTIDGCVFTATGYNAYANYPVSNWTFSNSIFNGYLQDFSSTYTYVNNNIFLGTGAAFSSCSNLYANNNIFYRATFPTDPTILYSKNVSFQSGYSFPNGSNYDNVDPMLVSNIGTGAYFDYATDYHLQSGSPVKNGGTDGTDVGPYGGNGDFDQSGVPRNPYIKTFTITGPTSVNSGDPLNIFIKAKVRN